MKTAIWVVLAAVLFGAAGFWGGVTYQKTQSTSSFAGRTGGFGGAGFGGGAAGRTGGSNVTTGTVLAEDAQSVTVSNLQPNTTYFYIIEATDASGNVSVSSQLTFATN